MINEKDILEEELALCEAYINFLERKKTGGILYIPEELFLGEDEELFADTLMEYMISAVRDEGSPASVVPIILRGPAEFHDKVTHTDLDGDFRDKLKARAYTLRKRIEELDESSQDLV